MADAWQLLLGPAPGFMSWRDEVAVVLSSGLPVPLFNPSFVVAPPDDPAATISQITERHRSRGTPFVIYARDEVAPGLADAGLEAGLVEHWQPALMVHEGPAEPSGTVGRARVRRLGIDEAPLHGEILAAAFGMPPEMGHTLASPTVLADPRFSAFVAGEDDERADATAAVICGSGTAGIYDVAVRPEAQGRGLGRAVTAAALAHAHQEGHRTVLLQSTREGERLYARMGFVTTSRYRQLEPMSDEAH